MSPFLSYWLMIWLIAMHRNEQTLTDTHKCVPHDDREHKCQRRHPLSVPLDVRVAFTPPWLRACVQVLVCLFMAFPF